METMEKLAALMATKEFSDTVDSMESPEELHAFLLAHGIDMSFAQVAEIVRSVNEAQLPVAGELTDAAMENVSGGMANATLWRLFKRGMHSLGGHFVVAADPHGRIQLRPQP